VNIATAPGVIVYRGSTRQPVLSEVQRALERGDNVIRVLLDGDREGKYVTLFAR
jgi:hypothetical protein